MRFSPPITVMAMLLFMLLGINHAAYCQSGSVNCSFNKTETVAKNKEIIDLQALLRNTTAEAVRVKLEIVVDAGLQLLTKNSVNDEIPAGGSWHVPVKIYVPQETFSDGKHTIRLLLRTEDNRLLCEDSCVVILKQNRNVSLLLPQTYALLDKSNEYLQIPVRLINSGNTTETVLVMATFPILFRNQIQEIIRATLPPFSDTTILYQKKATSEMYRRRDFGINITGLYDNGNIFGMASMNVQTARSTRSFTREQRMENDDVSGSISVAGHYLFSPYEFYTMTGGSSFDFSKSSLKYHIDATAWKNGRSPLLLRNTFLSYEQQYFGVLAGTINRNFERNISGRGGAFFLKDKKNQHRFEAGYVEDSHNLINTRETASQSGRNAWSNYSYHKKNLELTANALYDRSSFTSTESMVLSSEINLITRRKDRLSLFAGGGNISDRSGTDKARQGAALGFSYSGAYKKLSFSSNNYWSTPYYPGQRRGFLSFDNRISGETGGGSLWLAVSHYQFSPERLPGEPNFLSAGFDNNRVEIGFSFKAFKRIYLSLSSNVKQETNNFGNFLGISGMQTLKSGHFVCSGNFVNKLNTANVSCNVESGFFEATLQPGEYQFHLKSMMNVRYKWFSFSGIYQQGYFSIVEMINAQNQKGEYRFFSLTQELQRPFLNGLCEAGLGMTYTSNSNYGTTLLTTLRFGINLTRRTKAFFSVSRNQYSFGNYGMNNIEAGVTQTLRSVKVRRSRNYNLEVFVFKDINRNGVYDAGDSAAGGQIIRINDALLKTMPGGEAVYKHLPGNDYDIIIPVTDDWYAPRRSVKLEQDLRVEIPLQQTGRISGSVSYYSDEFSYATDKNVKGITITALSTTTGESFTAKTDDNGSFVFYLPVDVYTVLIKKEHIDPDTECPDNEQTITLSPMHPVTVNFSCHAKKRKVEMKKFRSSSLR